MSDQVLDELFDGDSLIVQIYDFNVSSEVSFPTPPAAEMQCAFGSVSDEKWVKPHLHKPVDRLIKQTSEFILVISGRMEITFFNSAGKVLGSRKLGPMQGFLQFLGGHEIIIKKNTKYIEIKQGPYMGVEYDKNFKF